MPELPEVETLARDLRLLLSGATIQDVEVLWQKCIENISVERFRQELVGRRIVGVDRRGKYLILLLDAGWRLFLHLRMSGRVEIVDETASLDRYARVILRLADGRRMVFCDPRKFGRACLTRDPAAITCKLGPEPLSPQLTLQAFRDLLSGRRTRIKSLLLRQDFVAGLGNIYADEALFAAGIHPLRSADSFSDEEAKRLYDGIRATLEKALCLRGTTLSDARYLDAAGRPGHNQDSLCVYQRTNSECVRCGLPVARIVVGGRGTHFCPQCQQL